VSELAELQEHLKGARQMIKASQRTLRGTLQYLADLEERLGALENAKPEEAQRYGRGSYSTREEARAGRS
jgi:hypothetical protein